MRSSIFSSIAEYSRSVWLGLRSTVGSSMTALPYLLSVRSGELRKEVTEQYPDPVSSRTADDLPPRSRGLLHNDISKCTGCRECEVVCPTRCIKIENDLEAETGKTWVAVFDVDFSRCTFCGLCVEACQPQSLTHTKQFEGAVYKTESMIRGFGKGRITPEQRARWAKMREEEESRDLTL